jgi:glycosyltransferase involved in cell wall biosynthesis
MSIPFLSVCIITKNEEKFIENCLLSIQMIADEIIIVDSNSTDQTKIISNNFPVKFFERKWNNDYSAARNYAIMKATGKWILFLDADERLENGQDLIETLKKSKSQKTGGYLLERKDIYRHKDNSKITYYNVGIVRVFRNKEDIRYRYKIHEQINASLIENNYEIKIEKRSKIIHLVEQSDDEFLDKKQRYYLKLLNESLKKDKNEPWLNYQKAKTLWYFNKLNSALKLFTLIAQNEYNPIDIRTSSYNQAAVISGIQKKQKLAFTNLQKSLNLIENQSLAHSVAYDLYYDCNQFTEAINSIKKVKTSISKCSWQHIIPGDLYIDKDVKNYKIGVCYLAENNLVKANYFFNNGIEFNFKSSENYYGKAVLMTYQGKIEDALFYIKKCIEFNANWKEALALKEFIDKNR